MPVTVRWDDEMERVLVFTYRGNWSWDDYESAAKKMWEMVEAQPGRVDRIIDSLSRVVALPPGVGQGVPAAVEKLHPRIMLHVVVGHDITRDILKAVTAQNPDMFRVRPYVFVRSFDEARRIIAESRADNQRSTPPTDGDDR